MVEGCVTKFVTKESWFDFQVLNAGAAARYGDNGRQVYYLKPPGNPYGATVTVVYGKNHGQHVVKPFIVVEQYNIAGAAPHLVDCNNANNTVEQLLLNIGNNFTNPFDFNASLESAGYDLVYIDFEQNLDDITRNAQVFQYVVQQVNAWKSVSQTQFGLSVEQNVVMGLSMGGLLARYGLAAMTKSSAAFGPPDTRLLVLHDSPQRGAYNPLGFQSLSRSTDVPLNPLSLATLGDLVDRLGDAINVLNQPATQQLAILNAFNGRGDIRPNTFIDGIYKNMVDFTLPANSSGPQPTYQIIATSDGSQCGRASGAPLGVQLSSIETRTTAAGVVLGTLISLFTPLPVLSRFSLGVRAAAYGLPAYGQQALISRMRVYVEYRIGFGYSSLGVYIPIRYNLLNERAISPPNTLPYETLPGGTTNLARESGDCGNQKFPISLFLRTSLYDGNICFVPTYSALDVPTVSPSTAYAKYINNTTDNPSIPRVGAYIAQNNPTNSPTEYNLNHLTFTARNSEWIFRQMQNDPAAAAQLACSTECTTLAISSSLTQGRLCAGSSITFSLANLPTGTAVTWSTSPAGYFTPGTGSGPSFTTTATNQQGTATVTALVGSCRVPVTASVGVGPAPIEGSYYCSSGCSSSTGPVQGQLSDFTIVPPGTYTLNLYTYDNRRYGTWQGQVDGGNWYTYNSNVSAVVTLSAGQRAQFTVPFSGSSCGAGSGTFTLAAYGGYRLVTTPNPASSDLVVTAVDEDQPETSVTPSATAPPFEVELYDSRGKKVKAGKSKKGKAAVDVRELPAGLYNVRAGKGKEAISKHIEITH